jgi:naphthalene 1,2-dioxygenase ferredoxin component
VTAIALSDRQIALYNLDGEIFATDNICTHVQALPLRRLAGGRHHRMPAAPGPLRRPHREGLGAPIDKDLTTVRVRTEGDDVLVEVTP